MMPALPQPLQLRRQGKQRWFAELLPPLPTTLLRVSPRHLKQPSDGSQSSSQQPQGHQDNGLHPSLWQPLRPPLRQLSNLLLPILRGAVDSSGVDALATGTTVEASVSVSAVRLIADLKLESEMMIKNLLWFSISIGARSLRPLLRSPHQTQSLPETLSPPMPLQRLLPRLRIQMHSAVLDRGLLSRAGSIQANKMVMKVPSRRPLRSPLWPHFSPFIAASQTPFKTVRCSGGAGLAKISRSPPS